MRKEVLAAVIIGLTLGLFITYGFYRVRDSISETTVTDLQTSPSPTPETTILTNLAIHSPEDGTIQTDTALTVAGATIPNALVVVFINDTDTITTADETGNFAVETTLQEGSNTIAIHVVDENGDTTKEERVVIVSSIFESTPEATDSATETENEDE
ncbi:MAG: hypothetical protein WAU07_05370 [Microgenomates group bacterium]